MSRWLDLARSCANPRANNARSAGKRKPSTNSGNIDVFGEAQENGSEPAPETRVLFLAAAARAARVWRGPCLKFARTRAVGTALPEIVGTPWPAFAASDLMCEVTLEHDCGQVTFLDRCVLLGAAAGAAQIRGVLYQATEVELLDGVPDALLVRVHARKCAEHPGALAVTEMAGNVVRFSDGSEVNTDV